MTLAKQKVLIISNHSFMLYRFRKDLIEALSHKFNVVVVVPFGDHIDDLKKLGCKCINVPVDRRGINPLKDIKLFSAYSQIIKAEKPAKVITYSIKPNVYAGFASSICGINYYTNVQGMGTAFEKRGLAEIATIMYKVALKNAQKVFFENSSDALNFKNKRIVTKKQIIVLPGAGVDLKQYPYEPYTEKNEFHFLYLGRIMKEKGIDEIFAACKKLFAEHKFVLDIVGFCEDKYEPQIAALKKQGIVVFHGFQNDPRPYYKLADCVLMPSYHEGMSNVNLEAAATGRVVITTDIPGCKEAVENGKTGFLVKPQDADSLYRTMKKVIDMDTHTLSKAGLLARERMKKLFDKKKVVSMTVNALS